MEIAALYDIHGNLPALEAVLADLERENPRHIVIGGDVLPGPMPDETLRRLFTLQGNVHFISGNGETAVLAELAGDVTYKLPEQAREAVRWSAKQLDRQLEEQLRSWPSTFHISVPHIGDVLFCHATPGSDTDIFTKLTPEKVLVPAFLTAAADLVICGHTHMQFDRKIGHVRVVNAGSVGMPFGAPGAHWLAIGSDIEFRLTAYDLSGAAERIRGTGYPQASEFAEHNVMNPPSEEQMLQLFTRAGLK